LKTIMSNRVP